jgi:hypothetical protein
METAAVVTRVAPASAAATRVARESAAAIPAARESAAVMSAPARNWARIAPVLAAPPMPATASLAGGHLCSASVHW